MDKKSRSQRNPSLKDLTPRNTTDVKGGAPASNLYNACCTGAHIKEATIQM